MNKLQSLVLAITLLVGSVSVATAQDYDKGLKAARAGDYQTALQEWRPLAEEGDADAQYELGYMYLRHIGVSYDDAEAAKWYRLAAEQGHANAQYELGDMYRRFGNGVLQDDAEAVKWWRLAAEQGHAIAQTDLGRMYEVESGVVHDYAEAVKWYRLAAEQGHANAQLPLGRMYEIGEGVLQSNIMAYMWYDIASANGNSRSGERRDELAGLMSQADISKAQQMTSQCMSSNYQNCGE